MITDTSEDEEDLLWEVSQEFYQDFGKLIATYLLKVPEHLREDIKERIQEKANVYSCCYEKYIKEVKDKNV